MTQHHNWQKSSYSLDNNNCLEIAADIDGIVHLRESDEPGTVLTTTQARLRALLTLSRSEQRRL